MTTLKITKYHLNSFKHSTSIFYGIFIVVCVVLSYIANVRSTDVSSSGLELSTIVFIFVTGLNIFKESFYFIKGNNVSRKDYLIATALSMISFSAILSLIDLMLNRIYNIFVESPMIYDMSFDNYLGSARNTIEVLLGSFLLQWGLCLVAISLGFLINLMYYRANKVVKLIISISPAVLIILINFISEISPNIIRNIIDIWNKIFKMQTSNVYTLFMFLIIGFLVEIGISHFLVRRATIKE